MWSLIWINSIWLLVRPCTPPGVHSVFNPSIIVPVSKCFLFSICTHKGLLFRVLSCLLLLCSCRILPRYVWTRLSNVRCLLNQFTSWRIKIWMAGLNRTGRGRKGLSNRRAIKYFLSFTNALSWLITRCECRNMFHATRLSRDYKCKKQQRKDISKFFIMRIICTVIWCYLNSLW